MALSRLAILNDLSRSTSRLLQRSLESPYFKNVRHFKRGKHVEEIKATTNPDSLATPFQDLAVNSKHLNSANLWKPFAFTVGFSVTCFGVMAIWEYENMRAHAKSMIKKPFDSFKKTFEKSNSLTRKVKDWWNSLSAGEKVFLPICAINVAVFAAWRVPRLQPVMLQYFCSNPGSKHVYLPMLLSTFSHYSGFHLLANMYVLHSFSTGAVHSLGKEQFLGLYLSAGVISSFTSYCYKVLTKQPGLSLGASGAIMAILGYVCTQYPDTRLGIILLPLFTFSAGTAIKFIVGLDAAGVILGWKFFDHAAHLGGAACGIFWALYGNRYVWQNREPLLSYWHQFRGAVK